MDIVRNRAFSCEAVLLDGKHIIDCTLENCELTYGGGAMILERTRISACDYMFLGQARRTVDLLRVVGILSEALPPARAAAEMVH